MTRDHTLPNERHFMQKLVLVLASLLSLGAVAPLPSLADTGKLSVSATFNPSPPKQGMETIIVRVKDASGKPFKGARVRVASDMPAMSMGGPTISAHDNGNGSYAAKINLNFATMWMFNISASAGKRKGSTQLHADIK